MLNIRDIQDKFVELSTDVQEDLEKPLEKERSTIQALKADLEPHLDLQAKRLMQLQKLLRELKDGSHPLLTTVAKYSMHESQLSARLSYYQQTFEKLPETYRDQIVSRKERLENQWRNALSRAKQHLNDIYAQKKKEYETMKLQNAEKRTLLQTANDTANDLGMQLTDMREDIQEAEQSLSEARKALKNSFARGNRGTTD